MSAKVQIIIGPPGCGKTTEVSRLVRDHVESRAAYSDPVPAVVCSLTRAAAAEVASERRGINLPRKAIGTLHSMAYNSIGCPKLYTEKIKDWNDSNKVLLMDGDGSMSGDEPVWDRDNSGKELGDGYRETLDLLRARMIQRHDWPEHIKKFEPRWAAWKRENDVVDFPDMIEMAIESSPTAPGNPSAVFADEVQDMSFLELSLLKKWGMAAGHLTLVGDPRQAIYVWRGAHPELFHSEKVTDKRTLEQSYRVPVAVHAVADRWARHLSDWTDIAYKPRNHPGSATQSHVAWQEPGKRLGDILDEYAAAGKSVMIAASCSYMLAPTIQYLRESARTFCNPWRSARGDWNPLGGRRGISMADRLSAFLKPSNPGWWSWGQVKAFAEPMRSDRMMVRGGKSILSSSEREDHVPAKLGELMEVFSEEGLRELLAVTDETESVRIKWWHGKLSPDAHKRARYSVDVAIRRGSAELSKPPCVYAGTIHSFKGAEADAVILYPDISNSGAREWNGRKKERDSVVRLGYVALTRAKEDLIVGSGCGQEVMPIHHCL